MFQLKGSKGNNTTLVELFTEAQFVLQPGYIKFAGYISPLYSSLDQSQVQLIRAVLALFSHLTKLYAIVFSLGSTWVGGKGLKSVILFCLISLREHFHDPRTIP